MKLHFALLLLFLNLLGCHKNELPDSPFSENYAITQQYTYNELIQHIGKDKLAMTVEKPNSEGALGRNKSGYFHVRFQMGMTSLTDYAIVTQTIEAIELYLQALNYSFDHQLNDGSFQFSPPESLIPLSVYEPPPEGDLVSATAFFGSSLGISLLSLKQSSWFLENPETTSFQQQIQLLKPNIEQVLTYLFNKQDLLKTYDAQAPNRLLFDALAFYTLGIYLEQNQAIDVGLNFLNRALDQVDTSEGYFIEGGGWDSSYNGVALKNAMELLSFLEDDTSLLKERITKATIWQISRIQPDGEISTEGNTRVYPGGEGFLGTEKQVDYVKTVRALYYFSTLVNDDVLIQLADQVLSFYN